MNVLLRSAAAAAVAGVVIAGGYAVAAPDDPPPTDPLGPEAVTVVVDVEHSRFIPSDLVVDVGTEVRFVVRNGDPINHELIVGPPDVHARHRNGTEAHHAAKPGELSVGPDEQGVTTYVFDEPGVVEMACHLPGHYDFGMRGEIEVVEPARRVTDLRSRRVPAASAPVAVRADASAGAAHVVGPDEAAATGLPGRRVVDDRRRRRDGRRLAVDVVRDRRRVRQRVRRVGR